MKGHTHTCCVTRVTADNPVHCCRPGNVSHRCGFRHSRVVPQRRVYKKVLVCSVAITQRGVRSLLVRNGCLRFYNTCRAQEEIASVLGDDQKTVEFDDLPRFEFIHDVIRETLRLYPPAPLLFRQPLKQYDVDGYQIPGGTGIVVRLE